MAYPYRSLERLWGRTCRRIDLLCKKWKVDFLKEIRKNAPKRTGRLSSSIEVRYARKKAPARLSFSVRAPTDVAKYARVIEMGRVHPAILEKTTGAFVLREETLRRPITEEQIKRMAKEKRGAGKLLVKKVVHYPIYWVPNPFITKAWLTLRKVLIKRLQDLVAKIATEMASKPLTKKKLRK